MHPRPDYICPSCGTPYTIAFHVYGLLDQRTRTVFYVGVTQFPHTRRVAHRSDNCSPAKPRIEQILGAGSDYEMCVLYTSADREAAKSIERRLIAEHPGLLNRQFHASNGYGRGA